MNEDSEEAKAIQKYWRFKKSGWEVRADEKSMVLPPHKCLQIDVLAASKASGVERHRLARVITQWEMKGLITSKGSKVRSVSI